VDISLLLLVCGTYQQTFVEAWYVQALQPVLPWHAAQQASAEATPVVVPMSWPAPITTSFR
jgi:hypothetical protein